MDQGSGPRRYFSRSAMNGRLYIHYVAAAISYSTPEEVDAIFNPLSDRRVHSVEDLEDVLRSSATRLLRFRMLYLAEGLKDEAHRRSGASG